MTVSFEVESAVESKTETEVESRKKDIQIRSKLNENENESGRTCEGGAKRPPVGRFTRFVFVFAFVFVELGSYMTVFFLVLI